MFSMFSVHPGKQNLPMNQEKTKQKKKNKTFMYSTRAWIANQRSNINRVDSNLFKQNLNWQDKLHLNKKTTHKILNISMSP